MRRFSVDGGGTHSTVSGIPRVYVVIWYGFRVQGLGFRVQGLGFRVQGLGPKQVPIWLLWGPSMYHTATWTLWGVLFICFEINIHASGRIRLQGHGHDVEA